MTGLDFWEELLQPDLLWKDFDDWRCEIGLFYRDYGPRYPVVGSQFWGSDRCRRRYIWGREHGRLKREELELRGAQMRQWQAQEEQRAGDHPAWDKQRRCWKTPSQMWEEEAAAKQAAKQTAKAVKLRDDNSVREKGQPPT